MFDGSGFDQQHVPRIAALVRSKATASGIRMRTRPGLPGHERAAEDLLDNFLGPPAGMRFRADELARPRERLAADNARYSSTSLSTSSAT